ncbi:hypothetical protein EYF80_057922 [Liparis tanakae]|uniref:Uncharacterized protein n=1 Tax=Liparis tanakae TaxID=230148 RepID=A0A4Z2ESY1_9TELE|nr:hypothetical protein EYF80_057922 [Liparis tanakae]
MRAPASELCRAASRHIHTHGFPSAAFRSIECFAISRVALDATTPLMSAAARRPSQSDSQRTPLCDGRSALTLIFDPSEWSWEGRSLKGPNRWDLPSQCSSSRLRLRSRTLDYRTHNAPLCLIIVCVVAPEEEPGTRPCAQSRVGSLVCDLAAEMSVQLVPNNGTADGVSSQGLAAPPAVRVTGTSLASDVLEGVKETPPDSRGYSRTSLWRAVTSTCTEFIQLKRESGDKENVAGASEGKRTRLLSARLSVMQRDSVEEAGA